MRPVPEPTAHELPNVDSDAWRRLPVQDELDVVAVRKCVRELGAHEGFSHAAIEALATASTEVARNIVVHAGTGQLEIAPIDAPQRRGIVVVARDAGPGIQRLDLALEDGYSTAGSLGLGLSSAKRLVDEFRVESLPEAGTVVTLCMWRV